MSPHDCVINKDKPYESLASAIVLQAAKDYRTVCQVLKIKPGDSYWLYEKKKLLRFFKSEWFTFLSGIDFVALLENLNKELA